MWSSMLLLLLPSLATGQSLTRTIEVGGARLHRGMRVRDLKIVSAVDNLDVWFQASCYSRIGIILPEPSTMDRTELASGATKFVNDANRIALQDVRKPQFSGAKHRDRRHCATFPQALDREGRPVNFCMLWFLAAGFVMTPDLARDVILVCFDQCILRSGDNGCILKPTRRDLLRGPVVAFTDLADGGVNPSILDGWGGATIPVINRGILGGFGRPGFRRHGAGG